jgi:hypothetical protein
MKYLKYIALLAVLALPLSYSQAEVRIGVGFGPGYLAGPPVCAYGYYPDYPYGCAPYGYYGSEWFVNGVFIGAGPWFHGWGHPYFGRSYGYGFNGRPDGRRYIARGPVASRGFEGRTRAVPYGGGFRGRR